VVGDAGVVVPRVLEDLEAERRAVDAGAQAGQQVAVVRGVEELALVLGGGRVDAADGRDDLVADLRVESVVEQDLGAAGDDGEARGGALEEVALEVGVDLVPLVDGGEVAVQSAEAFDCWRRRRQRGCRRAARARARTRWGR
jgi:hypothetical protein